MPFTKGGPQPTHKRIGRPPGFRGLAKKLAAETRDGDELVEFALKTFRSKKSSHAMRWQALEWISDRMLGKPMQMLELAAALEVDAQVSAKWNLAALDREQLAQLKQILLTMRAAIAAPPPLQIVSGEAPDAVEAGDDE